MKKEFNEFLDFMPKINFKDEPLNKESVKNLEKIMHQRKKRLNALMLFLKKRQLSKESLNGSIKER